LVGFAAIAVCKQDYETAAILASAVAAQLAATGIRLLYHDRTEYERTLAELRLRLDAGRLESLLAKGDAMSFDTAAAFALQSGG
jgi:hypothetical protein